jgi:pyruvate/2-oxoglutarate dehydrogenase complex dihydrolipoamide dehydrogenase (E3) component
MSKASEYTFDLIVIGAGSGGLNIASFGARIGLRTALIETSEDAIGGDCLNAGCVPSKSLLHVAHSVQSARNATAYGFTVSGTVSMEEVRSYIRSRQDVIRAHENRQYLEDEKGITVLIGTASFVDSGTVTVDDTYYCARTFVVATGSKPRALSIPGIENASVYTNETIFSMDTLPARTAVIGGGPIGVELGQALSRLGSSVSIYQSGGQLLPREDTDVASRLASQLMQEGIAVVLNARVSAIESGNTLVYDHPTGEHRDAFDALIVAVGRTPATETLNLEQAGIAYDERGAIVVDETLRTSNSRVYAVGDVIGQHQFTHAAELHASVVATNLVTPLRRKRLHTDHMAWVTYTEPAVATFGLSERTMTQRGMHYHVRELSFADDDRAIIESEEDGYIKVFISKRGTILGGTVIAKEAGELVQELVLAQRHSLRLNDLFRKVYPYPTRARVNRQLAAEWMGGKLTAPVTWFLRFTFRHL